MWCYSESMWLQNGVNGIEWDKRTLCVQSNEETCHPVQQCGSVMDFKSVWPKLSTCLENKCGLYTQKILLSRICLFFVPLHGISPDFTYNLSQWFKVTSLFEILVLEFVHVLLHCTYTPLQFRGK